MTHTDHYALSWLMTINDPSGRLMRWRLRLSEYRFTPKYKKGRLNALADMASRLPTNGPTPSNPDIELPCYTLSPRCIEEDHVDEVESEDYLHMDDPHEEVLAAEIIDEADLPSKIPLEELIREQEADEFCKSIRTRISDGAKIPFEDDPSCGALVRTVTPNHQLVIPKTLQPRLLTLAHYSKVAAHPGGRKMYRTLQRHYFFPQLAVACYNTVQTVLPVPRKKSVRGKPSRT